MAAKVNKQKTFIKFTASGLNTKIKELVPVCPFPDLQDFYTENKGLVKKFLRKNTMKLVVEDIDEESIPESWWYKNKEGLIRAKIKDREFTTPQKLEWIKCATDVVYFTRKYIKIISIDDGIVPFNLYDYQEELLRLYSDNRFSISLQARQSGKTQTTASFILHFALFTEAKFSAILAQKADQAQEILERIQLSYEMLPVFLQPGVKTYNKRSMIFGNNSKIQTFASTSGSVRGKSIALLYVDETAFIPRDMEFYESTYPTIASGKESKVILTSTPNGTRGMFYKLWSESVEGKNSYVRKIVTWDMVPGRDAKWKKETIDNSSPEQFRQEHECHFRGSVNSLINGEALERLVSFDPVETINDLKIYREPEADHKYVTCVDCSEGVGNDYHAITTVDISVEPYEVVSTFKNNKLSPLVLPEIIYNIAKRYNESYVLIENQSTGGEVGRYLFHDFEYENTLMTVQEKGKQVIGFNSSTARIGVKTSKAVKAIGCSTIKSLIEDGRININSEEIIGEFGDFIPKGSSYAAADGAHDDQVMTLVLFGWLLSQPYFVDESNVDLRKSMVDQIRRDSEEDIMPFGFIDDEFSSDRMPSFLDDEVEDYKNYGVF